MNLYLQRLTIESHMVRLVIWLMCMMLIIFLGWFRILTNAQFIFASLMWIPVLLSAWFTGRTAGWLCALLATTLWSYADYATGNSIKNIFIVCLNFLTHTINYGVLVELTVMVRTILQRESNNARIDTLTGLLNRRGFMEMVIQQTSMANRLHISVAIFFIDFDLFKRLNDGRGHKVGDTALSQSAKVLQQALRSSDICGRIGGDEFCVYAYIETLDKTNELATKIHKKLKDALVNYKPTGVSIGVAFFESPEWSIEDMLHFADKTMYEVKHTSKGGVLVREATVRPPQHTQS